jgi:hypothetical protein
MAAVIGTDIEGVQVVVKLPEYAQWQDRLVTTVGNLRYDPASRQVIWEIPQLARNNSEIQAEFSLNFKPLASQRNKIIVLLPVVEAQATDTVTKGSIKRSASVKTSKLEDDSVVQSVNLDAASGLIK